METTWRVDAPLLFITWLSLVRDQLRKHNSPLRGFLAKWKAGTSQLFKTPELEKVDC